MSRKSPKKYDRQSNPKVTAAEERQARRVINGIVIALLAIMVIIVLVYKLID